jgi:hypothetical protein
MTIVATVGATNANSYVDLAYANTYFTSRLGSAAWGNYTNPDKEAALIQAASLMDSMFDWIGDKDTEEQSMRWPRAWAYDLDDYLIDSDVIPENVKRAQCELAFFLVTSGGYAGTSRGIDRFRVGPIMLDFDDSAAALPIPQVVIDLLRGYGAYRGSGKSGNLNVPLVRV